MYETRVRTPFLSPHGKRVIGIIGGGMMITYFAMLGVKRDVQEKEGNVAIHKEEPRPGYITTDALHAVARPAKNANVKGALPTSSQWV